MKMTGNPWLQIVRIEFAPAVEMLASDPRNPARDRVAAKSFYAKTPVKAAKFRRDPDAARAPPIPWPGDGLRARSLTLANFSAAEVLHGLLDDYFSLGFVVGPTSPFASICLSSSSTTLSSASPRGPLARITPLPSRT